MARNRSRPVQPKSGGWPRTLGCIRRQGPGRTGFRTACWILPAVPYLGTKSRAMRPEAGPPAGARSPRLDITGTSAIGGDPNSAEDRTSAYLLGALAGVRISCVRGVPGPVAVRLRLVYRLLPDGRADRTGTISPEDHLPGSTAGGPRGSRADLTRLGLGPPLGEAPAPRPLGVRDDRELP